MVTTPFTFTYSTAPDCVAQPIRAASSGAIRAGAGTGPVAAASELFAKATMLRAIPAISSALTSTLPSAP